MFHESAPRERTHEQSFNLLKYHFIPTFSRDVSGATLPLLLSPETSVPSPSFVTPFWWKRLKLTEETRETGWTVLAQMIG
jgi:hypothetical protein